MFQKTAMKRDLAERVCIIGAGVSGLCSIKACLEEGLKPVCYEKTNAIGGLWYYREDSLDGVGSVMKSTHLNTSKEMISFSDFPPPPHYPNYMHNTLMLHYLQTYAKCFELIPHIQLETEVLKVEWASDYHISGRWSVRSKAKNGDVTTEIFDAVLVCTGHHAYPSIPDIDGLGDFEGIIRHSHSYKTEDDFRNKRVLVVGVGSSGGDIAVEVSHVAKKAYLSTRRGVWVISRVAEGGFPVDIKYKSRMYQYLLHYVAWNLLNAVAEAKANYKFDHGHYSLKPDHRFLSQHAMVNDELPARLITGSVTVKDDVLRFTEHGVIFKEDDGQFHQLDAVIFATGYKIVFPFLDDGIIPMKQNRVALYKFVFPPHLVHPTLAVIGLVQVEGGIAPSAEMQARWAARVFRGSCTLPGESVMLADINRKKQEMKRQFFESQRHTLEANYVWYQDELAKLIGAYPNFRWMFFTDPALWWACFFGPNVPYIYRLTGPNAWEDARDTILTVENRVLAPLKSRRVRKTAFKEEVLGNLHIAPIFTIIAALIITFFSTLVTI